MYMYVPSVAFHFIIIIYWNLNAFQDTGIFGIVKCEYKIKYKQCLHYNNKNVIGLPKKILWTLKVKCHNEMKQINGSCPTIQTRWNSLFSSLDLGCGIMGVTIIGNYTIMLCGLFIYTYTVRSSNMKFIVHVPATNHFMGAIYERYCEAVSVSWHVCPSLLFFVLVW